MNSETRNALHSLWGALATGQCSIKDAAESIQDLLDSNFVPFFEAPIEPSDPKEVKALCGLLTSCLSSQGGACQVIVSRK